MSLRQAARIAARELRGGLRDGLRGFRIFLACLALGVGAIAAVGSVRGAIEVGLADQGAVLLGGDAELEFTYRQASPEERQWMDVSATKVSEIYDLRAMIGTGSGDSAQNGLTQLKAVDAAYPLVGEVLLDPAIPLATALGLQDGLPGAVMDAVLIDRMGLTLGDRFRLAGQDFRLSATLLREPDSAGAGFSLGPRTIVATSALQGSMLLQPGTLYETKYRLTLAEGTDLAAAETAAKARFDQAGVRWRDRRAGAPGVTRFVERMGAFLVLVGLAGLAVGGVGVSAAVRAYLERKTAVIATLKTLGADSRTIFLTYALQIGALSLLGVALGLAFGLLAPLMLAPLIESRLPIALDVAPHPAALAQAAVYGLLTAALFTLWPLMRTAGLRAATLYRAVHGSWTSGRPPLAAVLALAVVLTALLAAMAGFTGMPKLALSSAAGVAMALGALMLTAFGLKRLARRLSGARLLRGRPALRLALGSVAGPGQDAGAVILSLGLGLAVLAAVGQIDSNLRQSINRDLPDVAPAYFVVDIQQSQITDYLDRLAANPAVSRVDSAPMLRGIITRINDRPATEVAGDHWVVRGDRGLTYADVMPKDTTLTAGQWWPSSYDGPPQISFAREEAEEIGLNLGDRLTVNILGRDITATITSFREVDFSTAGIGFVMVMSPNALAGAPHSFISTIYTAPAAEAALLRDLAQTFPNITAIRVRDVIARVSEALGTLSAATRIAAAATLLTGFMVLIGAAAAGETARIYEAAILKTLGATRGQILRSLALRAAILGAAAGGVAVLAGAAAGWSVMFWVMQTPFRFDGLSAALIIGGGVLATLLSGMAFAWRPLSTRPAGVLRQR